MKFQALCGASTKKARAKSTSLLTEMIHALLARKPCSRKWNVVEEGTTRINSKELLWWRESCNPDVT